MASSDYAPPHPVQFRGHALARWLLQRLGWQVEFQGLPTQQGVLAVYPHTSNWDFVLLLLVKWSLGIPVRFWGKSSLFSVPVFGAWLRMLGGVPVERTSAQGMVQETVAHIARARAEGDYFWLALAPEGTRKLIPGWRSGFYRTAVGAQVPLGAVVVNYARRQIRVVNFLRLSGDEARDFARMAQAFEGAAGLYPEQASPIRLLDPTVSRQDTVVK